MKSFFKLAFPVVLAVTIGCGGKDSDTSSSDDETPKATVAAAKPQERNDFQNGESKPDATPKPQPAGVSRGPGETELKHADVQARRGNLANGLFPQPGATDFVTVFNRTGVGGGLFPQRGTVSGESIMPEFSSTGRSGPNPAPQDGNSVAMPGARGGMPEGADEPFGGDGGESPPEGEADSASQFGELYDVAVESFKAGDGSKGFDHLNAFLIANNDSMDNYPMKWYAGIKRPRVAVRWAVGVQVAMPANFSGRFPVLGENVAGLQQGAGRRGAGGMSAIGRGGARGSRGTAGRGPATATAEAKTYSFANVDTSTANGALYYYTGELGVRLVHEFNERREAGRFGPLLAAMPDVAVPVAAGGNGRNARAPGRAGRAARGVAAPLRAGPGQGGMQAGARVPGAPNNAPQPARGADEVAALLAKWSGNADSQEPDADLIGELTPGLIGIGFADDRQVLADRAIEQGADLLFVFTVRVTEARNGNVSSSTSLRLINPAEPGEALASTSTLKPEDVVKAREKARGHDPVERQLARVFDDYLDQALAPADMPATLNAENATRRVQSLARAAENPLRDTAEVVWYFRESLIDEATAQRAIDSLLDGAGATVVTGSEDERTEMLSDHLAR